MVSGEHLQGRAHGPCGGPAEGGDVDQKSNHEEAQPASREVRQGIWRDGGGDRGVASARCVGVQTGWTARLQEL